MSTASEELGWIESQAQIVVTQVDSVAEIEKAIEVLVHTAKSLTSTLDREAVRWSIFVLQTAAKAFVNQSALLR